MGESYNTTSPVQTSLGRASELLPQTPCPAQQAREHRHEPGNQAMSGAPETVSKPESKSPLELDMEWLKIAEEDSAVIVPHIGLGSSFVTLGAGLAVRSLKCGFDTCLIEMKNLPLDAIPKEIETLLSTQGVRPQSFRVIGTQQYGDGTISASILAQKDAAKQLASRLDGSTFKGRKVEFNVVGYNSLPAIQSVRSNILTLSWEAPESQSMVALLSYRDPQTAQSFVEHLNNHGLEGHSLRAHVVMPGPDSQGTTLVKTAGLPNGLNPFQLYSCSRAQSILIQPNDNKQDVIASVMQHLGLDPYQTFNRVASYAGRMFGVLSVTLNSWKSVKQACESLSGRRIKPDYPILRCYLPFGKPIHHAVYIPLEHHYMHYWNSIAEQHRIESAISSMHSNHGCIPPVGERAEDGRLIVRVDNIRLDRNPTASYWRWACSSGATLHAIQIHLGISLIELSWATRTLRLFAEDQGSLDRAVHLIKTDIVRTALAQRVIAADRILIRSLQTSGALATLRERFGPAGHVILDISPGHCMLKHDGSYFPAVQELLAKHKGQIENYQRSMRLDEIDTSCPICLDDFSDANGPVQRLTCGHVYCSTCLHQFLVTAPERNKYPLTCIGNEDRCQTMIPIPIIQSALSPQEFNSLVEKALSAHVGKNVEQYKYCPTATCTQLYRASTDTGRPGTVLTATCPSCALDLCTACHKPAHPGLTCAERQAQDPSENDILNAQWASTNGAKKCPTCSVWIQKTDGCNHVRCRCGAHMCWICGRAFNDGNATYRHLRVAHGVGALFLDVGGAGNPVGGAQGGGQRPGNGDDFFFGAPPGPGEVLIGPGGVILAVGPGGLFGRAIANGQGGGNGDGARAGAGNPNPNPNGQPHPPAAPGAFPGFALVRPPNPGFGHPVGNNPTFFTPPVPNAVQR
ncbi:hypothetical protein AX15_007400 [Amanita polypyramis BW_CC]|nr:hypothetical protein AX15_007400 [Amanita polypyramis BW_CC]